MRGLAFPTNAVFDRETSYEYGTPASNVDDIPIDPALGGLPIDPSIMTEGGMNHVQNQAKPDVLYPQHYSPNQNRYSQEPRHYSQGPQGDPFAPQPPAAYLAIEEEQRLPPPKPVKRKRKPRREEECGFCQGNDLKNKNREPEVMVTCTECGRSGHPSCMGLDEVGDVVRSYPWKCLECKTCEICQEKGDDERILFCDFCDRGWHMDCIVPPIESPPTGKWHCPQCPELDPDGNFYHPSQPELQPEDAQQLFRESSLASSSHSPTSPIKNLPKYRGKGKGKGKGKGRAIPADDSELEVETPTVVRSRGRPRMYKKGKTRTVKEEVNTDEEEEAEGTASPPREPRPKRTRIHSPAPRSRIPGQKGKGKEREEDEPPKGLFDDILSEADRDTSKTSILLIDKQQFERSRLVAEGKLAPPPPPPQPAPTPEVPNTPTPGPSSRPLRSSTIQQLFPISTSTPSGLSTSPAPSTPGGPFTKSGPSTSIPTLRIRTIRFGQFDIKTWYDAPFPEEYATIPDGRLWICEFCLKYMKSRFGAVRHRMKCRARHPPGDEIYRDGVVSIFEVDGRKNKIYCQNLCLLSKMFLDHKSLFYDVEPFLFYVITETDEYGARFVGYFSKEKRSPKDYNVSCIMTLPVRQRQGWGNLLIDFSYLLSKKEQRLGSPEKPLSSLGALGYRNYWTLSLMRYLEQAPDNPRLEDICAATSMTIEDVHTTLTQQNMISVREVTPPPIRPSPGQSIKFPKGRKNGIARRALHRTQTHDEDTPKGPFVAPTQYHIHWDREKVEQYLRNWEAKGYLRLKPEKLKWSPFLLARTKKTEAMQATEISTLMTTGKLAKSATNGNAPTSDGSVLTPNGITGSPIAIDDDAGPSERTQDVLPMLFPPETPGSRSPDKKAAHLAWDRALTRELADSPSVPKRRLSSRSSTKTPLRSASEDRPTRARPTRSTSSRTADQCVDDSLADDEALAAKLALEEQRQHRHLRSRQDSGQEPKSTVSNPSTKIISSRKRRRVESSPEAEDSPPPSATPVMSINGKQTPNHEEPPLSVQQPKPPEQMNGAEIEPQMPHPLSPIHLPSNIEGLPTLEPAKYISIEKNIHIKEPEANHDIEPDGDSELELKSEDLGTPLTSLTSRQSLPSDDTISAADTTVQLDVNVNLNGKPPNGVVDESNGDTIPKQVPSEGPADNLEAASVNPVDDEDCDADADGEYEEDAEGEPDDELLAGAY